MKLHYKLTQHADNKPVLLFLHGLLGSASNWHSIAQYYAKDYTILIPDLRNHGLSEHHAIHDYPEMGADLVELLTQLNIQQCIVIGHSMGGKVAMQLALQTPQIVTKLVIVDIAPVVYQHDFTEIYQAMLSLDLNLIKNRQAADQGMAKIIKNKAIRQFLLQNLVRQDQQWFWRVDIELLRRAMPNIGSFEDSNQYFNKKCLFIRGALSNHIKKEYYPTIKKYFPEARIETIEQAGHWVYYEQKTAFLTLLSDFLRD